MAAVDLAHAIAEQGRPVLPTLLGLPLCGGNRWGGTLDAEHIERWWQRWPDADVAIATGVGLVVLDVDVHRGGQARSSWPLTLTASTPSGGLHIYYRCSPDLVIPTTEDVLGPGVTVRGEGDYVVAPDQRGRQWADLMPIVELPDELAAVLVEPS